MAHQSKDPAEMPTLSRGVVLVQILEPSTALGGVHVKHLRTPLGRREYARAVVHMDLPGPDEEGVEGPQQEWLGDPGSSREPKKCGSLSLLGPLEVEGCFAIRKTALEKIRRTPIGERERSLGSQWYKPRSQVAKIVQHFVARRKSGL
jgi:hypothetical protein